MRRIRSYFAKHRYWKTGSWGLPSGYANQNERLEDTIAREVREETGYIVKTTELLQVVSGFKLRLKVSYKAELVGGQQKIDSSEIRLFRSIFPHRPTTRWLVRFTSRSHWISFSKKIKSHSDTNQ